MKRFKAIEKWAESLEAIDVVNSTWHTKHMTSGTKSLIQMNIYGISFNNCNVLRLPCEQKYFVCRFIQKSTKSSLLKISRDSSSSSGISFANKKIDRLMIARKLPVNCTYLNCKKYFRKQLTRPWPISLFRQ